MSENFKWIPDHAVLAQVGILAEKMDYNHKMMNIPEMWKTTKGGGVRVVVIDTGVPNHVDLMPDQGGSVIADYEEDLNGHGTHCGGIIAAIANNNMGVAGIAPEVEDCYIAALDGSGSGSTAGIARAIRMAVDEMDADIISMSLGISAGHHIFNNLEEACNYAVSKGVAVFAAAGNEYGDIGQPACYDSVISVAAVDSRMAHADFSNTGPELDFAAGGVNVYSTYLNNTYAKLSGTSMACPALAAVGALIQSKHMAQGEKLSPQELKEHLRKIAYDVGPVGFDETYGHGIPIFGKEATPIEDNPVVDDPPVDPPADNPDSGSKKGPQANCVYWNLWADFISTVGDDIGKGQSLEDAIAAGLASTAARTKKFDALIRKK